MTEVLAIISALLGLILYIIKGKRGESPELKYARRVVSRADKNIQKARRALRERDISDLKEILDRQQRDIDALRGVLEKDH